MGFNVSTLPNYTKKAEKMLKEGVVFPEDYKNFTLQAGVVHKAKVNFMETDPQIQAYGCDMTPVGETQIVDKEIEVVHLGVMEKYCFLDLEQKDLNGADVAKDLTSENVLELKAKNDKLLWQGSVAGSDLINGWKYWMEKGITTITDEAVTATALDTAYSLVGSNVSHNSVVVQDSTDTTTYAENTDYSIDYIVGTITAITGGAITAEDVLHVDYIYTNVGATTMNDNTPITISNIDDKLDAMVMAMTDKMENKSNITIRMPMNYFKLARSNRNRANQAAGISEDLGATSMKMYGNAHITLIGSSAMRGIDDMYLTYDANYRLGTDEIRNTSSLKWLLDEIKELAYLKGGYFLGTQLDYGTQAIRLRSKIA